MSAKYFNQLKLLYNRKLITLEGLKQSVKDGLLTTEEYFKITNKEYVE